MAGNAGLPQANGHLIDRLQVVHTVRLYSAKNGAKEHTGTLCGYDGGAVSIETPAGTLRFEKNEVAMVRLHVDF